MLAMFASIAMREYVYFAALNDKTQHYNVLEYFLKFSRSTFDNPEILQKLGGDAELLYMDIDSVEYEKSIMTDSYFYSVGTLNVYFHNIVELICQDIELITEGFISIHVKHFAKVRGMQLKVQLDIDRIVTSAEFSPILMKMDEMISLSEDEKKVTDFVRARTKERSLFCPKPC